jgi:hypothetical protein
MLPVCVLVGMGVSALSATAAASATSRSSTDGAQSEPRGRAYDIRAWRYKRYCKGVIGHAARADLPGIDQYLRSVEAVYSRSARRR